MSFQGSQAGSDQAEQQKNDPQFQSSCREPPGEDQQSKKNEKQNGRGMVSEEGSHIKSL
jgi:hypothetical protein